MRVSPLNSNWRISAYLLVRVRRTKMAPVTPRFTGSTYRRSRADEILLSRTQPNVLLMSQVVAFAAIVASTNKRYSSICGHVGGLNISEQNWTHGSRADAAATRMTSSSYEACETSVVNEVRPNLGCGDISATLIDP
jgi:hypothetical protein